MSRSKVLTAAAAAALIKDGSVVGIEGAGRLLLSEAISSAVERRFLADGHPHGITLMQPCGFGDDGDAGASHFAHEGLVRRVISPGWGDSPRMANLALANKVQAYCFPQGVVCQMVWAAASRKPRLVSHVGLDTFVDPRQSGGRLNAVTTEELVERVEIDGADWLSFKVVPIDVAIIRGTTADEFGNLSMEHEPAILEPLTLAQAAHANGGLVLAEVKRVVRRGSLNPQLVRVPGILIDAIVVNPDAWQIHGVERYNPAVCGEIRAPRDRAPAVSLDERMLVARRAAMELRPGAVINIGFGISDGVPVVAAQEGLLDDITITIEQGTIGGLPMRGRAVAAQTNVEAIVDQISQFNFYQGGGLDLAFLSFAEVDAAGNVNVSKFGSRLPGCGGFIDISQNAKQRRLLRAVREGGRRPDRERTHPRRRAGPRRQVPERGRAHHVQRRPGSGCRQAGPLRHGAGGLRTWAAGSRAPGDRPRVRSGEGRARRDGIPACDRERSPPHGGRHLRGAPPRPPGAMGFAGRGSLDGQGARWVTPSSHSGSG